MLFSPKRVLHAYRDMGSEALNIVDSLDENLFNTSDVFFSTILDVWKRLGLI